MKPELLAPGGSEESLIAAVENGADAVYFGVTRGKTHSFNARVRAKNIPLEKLADTVTFLHRRNVKAYLTLNTLAFTEELPQIETLLQEFVRANVDAVLVQDLGVARLAYKMCPDLALHASTQMSLSSAESFSLAARYGIKRVVLPRELSMQQIRLLRDQLQQNGTEIELEAFVHGALCMSYSGQCFASLFLGGYGSESRSANRGSCAQPCRMLYTLIDGVSETTSRRLFSPTDLSALELIQRMFEAGIVSFKIEGRLKPPEYVAETTRIYREAIDTIFETATETKSEQLSQHRRHLTSIFSRGFSTGWLQGTDPSRLVPGNIRAHRGTLLGTVLETRRDAVVVLLCDTVCRGDGVVSENEDENSDDSKSQGGRIYEIYVHKKSVKEAKTNEKVLLTFGNDMIDTRQIKNGQKIRKTDDPRLERRIRKSLQSRQVRRRIPLNVKIRAIVGESFFLEASASNGAAAEIVGDFPLEEAKKHPLTLEILREQFGRLGDTIYELKALDVEFDTCSENRPMIPLSVLGSFRREMIAALDRYDHTLRDSVTFSKTLEKVREESFSKIAEHTIPQPAAPVFHFLFRDVRYFEDRRFLKRCIEGGCRSFYAELRDHEEYRLAAESVRSFGAEFIAAAPRILEPGETGFLDKLVLLQPDGVLVRNLGALAFFQDREIRCVTDFSLNIVNDLAIAQLLELGSTLDRITLGFDLDAAAADTLLNMIPPERVEWIVQGRVPLFTMKHCLWKANLIPADKDAQKSCRRMCRTHPLKIRDRYGAVHPVRSDGHCRNFLESATPLQIPKSLRKWIVRGLRHLRIEWDDTIRNEKETFALLKSLLD